MFLLDSFNDLLTRPVMEAYIERELKKRNGKSFYVPKYTEVGRGKGTSTDMNSETDVLNALPHQDFLKYFKDIFKQGPAGQEYGSSVQHPQYVALQLLLKLFGLADYLTSRDRVRNGSTTNKKEIDTIYNLTSNVFTHLNERIRPDAPAALLRDVLYYNYNETSSSIYFLDYMRHEKNWDNLLVPSKLKQLIRNNITTRVYNKYEAMNNDDDDDLESAVDTLGNAANDALRANKDTVSKLNQAYTKAGLNDKVGSENINFYDVAGLNGHKNASANLNGIKGTEAVELSEKDKAEIEEEVEREYKIIRPGILTMSKLGDTPAQAFLWAERVSRVKSAITDKNRNNISSFIEEINAQKTPNTVIELERNILEGIRKAEVNFTPKNKNNTTQISNVYAEKAAKILNKLALYFVYKKGWEDGLTIDNVFKFIKTDNSREAENARNTLKNDFGISLKSLNTKTYPTFNSFVLDLQRKNKRFVSEYLSVKRPSEKGKKAVIGLAGDMEKRLRSNLNASQKSMNVIAYAKKKSELATYGATKFNNNEINCGDVVVGRMGSDDEPEVWTPEKAAVNKDQFVVVKDKLEDPDYEPYICVAPNFILKSKYSGWDLSSSNVPIMDFSGNTKSEIEDFIKVIKSDYDDDAKVESKLNIFWLKTPEAIQLKPRFKEMIKDQAKRDAVIKTIKQYILFAWARQKATADNNVKSDNGEAYKEWQEAIARFNELRAIRGKEGINIFDMSKDDFKDDDDDDSTPEENFIRIYVPIAGQKELRGITSLIHNNILPKLKEKYDDNSAIISYKPYDEDGEIILEFARGGGFDKIKTPEKFISYLINIIKQIIKIMADKEPSKYRSLTVFRDYDDIKCIEAHMNGDDYEYQDSRLFTKISNYEEYADDEDCEEVDLALDAFNFDEDGIRVRKPKQEVKFISNKKRYGRLYQQDAWRQEDYYNRTH